MKKRSWDYRLFNGISVIYLTFCIVICLLPFYLIVIGSFTDNLTVIKKGFSIWPEKFSLDGYKLIFKAPEIVFRAYGVSIFITVVGTICGLFFTTLTAFALYRMNKKYSKVIGFYFYFTVMFGGGLIPWYIWLTKTLHMTNNLLALIIPVMFNVVYIFLMRNFIKAIPMELYEAAQVEGASEWHVYLKIVVPLIKPAMATIGLYLALDYWNNWFYAMLFINNEKLYPLQYLLYQMLYKIDALNSLSSAASVPTPNMPTETFKLVITTIVIGPIILIYPFAQKYFVKDSMAGAVKG